MIISTAITAVVVVPAVRPLQVVGGDGVNQWMSSTIVTVVVMEAGAFIIETDDLGRILLPPPPRLPVPAAALVTLDVDHLGVVEEDLLLMIVLLEEEVAEAAETIEIIEVVTILVGTAPEQVAAGEEGQVLPLRVLAPDREKV